MYPRTGQRDHSSGCGRLSDTGLCYGYWPKWFGTELKKAEHALSKITATSCDRHAGRRIRTNIAEPTLGIILRSYDYDSTRGTHRRAAESA